MLPERSLFGVWRDGGVRHEYYSAKCYSEEPFGRSPDFYKSLLIEGCLESGKDYRRGGAPYTEGLADVLGITNFGDSLLVIKKLVYDEKHLKRDS